MNRKIAIIGGGNLGTAIAEGLLKSGYSDPGSLYVTRRNPSLLQPLQNRGVNVLADNRSAVQDAGIVLLCVKPFQVMDILREIGPALSAGQVLVSVVTGISLEELEGIAGKEQVLFRAMPNTAIAIQESMTCLSYHHAGAEQVREVNELFSRLGKVVTIDEKLMDAATVLGACGTAYAMRYIRANIQGGIEIGFDALTASIIAAQTVKGAAELLLQKGSHPEQEIDRVTTPKGCTIAGLNEIEHRGFSSSLIRGLVASYKKITRD